MSSVYFVDIRPTLAYSSQLMASIVESRQQSTYFSQHVNQYKPGHIGRQRGTKNRIGVNIRKTIEKVFGALGDWEGMVAWAKDNPDVFYGQVVPKLLPHELAESGLGNQIRVIVYGQTPNNNPSDTPLQVVGELVPDEARSVSMRKDEDGEVSCTPHEPEAHEQR